MKTLRSLFNPIAMLLAGRRIFPLYGVIHHRGRRSGKPYHVPVVVRPNPDGLTIPMPWGEGTDWYRNVQSAGGCLIHWKGRDFPMTDPELGEPGPEFGPLQRAALRLFGIRQCLRLRHQR